MKPLSILNGLMKDLPGHPLLSVIHLAMTTDVQFVTDAQCDVKFSFGDDDLFISWDQFFIKYNLRHKNHNYLFTYNNRTYEWEVSYFA